MSTTLASTAPLPAAEIAGKPTPRFYLGAVIIFWGWQNQLLGMAIGMAVLVEMAYWLRTYTGISWHLSDKDFNRFADFTTLLWVSAALYFFNKESIDGLFSVLRWFPLLIFLLLLAQLYSTRQHLPLSALFWSLRFAAKQNHIKHNAVLADNLLLTMRIDLSYPYAVICMLSASVLQQPYFLLGVFVFFAWGLYSFRSKRYSLSVWVLTLSLVGAGSYLGQQGIQILQYSIERWVLEWFEAQLWHSRDPYRQNTRIGDIGELKLSNQILFRVKAPMPLLLREASYDRYKQQNWHAQQVNFNLLPLKIDANRWALHDNAQNPPTNIEHLDVSLYLYKGQGMLPLPANSLFLYALSGLDIQRNRFDDALKITEAPALLNYGVDYAPEPMPSPLQQKREELLDIPEREADVLQQIATDLGIHDAHLKPSEKIRRIEHFFAQHFHYALVQREQNSFATPLAHFLLKTRQGHCEYFATSTVLLLREAGIPSRYAVGYAVQEYSFLEDTYLVRRRHAHAWAQAYLDGRWLDVDTTPSDWVELEAKEAGHWQWLGDLWSWLKFSIDQWRWRASDSNNSILLWWLMPLIALLMWRLSLHKKFQRKLAPLQATPLKLNKHGEDSPFYAVLKQLHTQGYSHAQGQALRLWLQQLQTIPHPSIQQQAVLPSLLAFHNRYRFHPQSLSTQEKIEFAQAVETWLQAQRT